MSRWKATLRLPKSTFPARPNPQQQSKHLRESTEDFYKWQASHRPKDNLFVLHDGPPYANGPLHIGHAINKILKDAILRVQIQTGKQVAYRPSWDCHGLPIEMKALGSNSAASLPPSEVRKSAKKLASKTITEQMKGFKSFGIMADWDNKWTTMDKEFEIRQLQVFQQMVKGGLIYRKYKPVYWSISSGTALAEAELEYRDDHESKSAFVKYHLESGLSSVPELKAFDGNLYAAIWTTTPWTLPANQAIAVHKDIRYSVLRLGNHGLLVASSRVESMLKFLPSAQAVAEVSGAQLNGLTYRNKLRGASAPAQPIIHADFVTADSGTGLVHVAPGHGQDDYLACAQLGIEAFAPVDDNGFFTQDAYPDDPEKLTNAPSILEGGGQAVLDLLEDDVLRVHNIQHKYPYDWRTKRPVVTRATAQWFADVGSIKKDALQALRDVRFVPKSGRDRLESFIKARSEWCISRQRSWGVPIPALFDKNGEAVMNMDSVEHIISVMKERGSDAWFLDSPDDPAWIHPSLQGEYRRGRDTMDVWFDSGSSWTEVDKQVDIYLEGSDQHRGWFQSSLLTYIAAQKARASSTPPLAPFQTLITHGFTLDGEGKKMSKSIGNTVSPAQVMEGTLLPTIKSRGKGPPRHDALGADALRLWALSSDFTSDVSIGPIVLAPVHSALIKYRTILKMLLGSLHEDAQSQPLTMLDRMALVQLSDTMFQVSEAYRQFEFHKATQLINRWVSADLSAFYLEAVKDRLYCGDGGGVVGPILRGLLRMLAPITPVLVQEAWDHCPLWFSESPTVQNPAQELWDASLSEHEVTAADRDRISQNLPVIYRLHSAIRSGLEKARINKLVGSSLQCSVIITTDDRRILTDIRQYGDELADIFVVSSIGINEPLPTPPAWSYVEEIDSDGLKAAVHILPPTQHKCSRCWRYIAEEDGEDALCHRCDAVVSQ